jgi:hypothetical protein
VDCAIIALWNKKASNRMSVRRIALKGLNNKVQSTTISINQRLQAC